ncbi:MAG: thymidylate synthase (FAD) [Anaerolineaceae bacterium 4572_78]|nr:MAG: thymidylate synthase (FAD) [Anaerolineaceae bacterium 4572_78]
MIEIPMHVPVLDKGFVELIDMMPHPSLGVHGDLAIVNAARVSFLGESKGDGQDKKLLFYLLQHSHTSPFEQVEFKFRIRAPLVTWWHLVRHRTAHLNMQSGRYTSFQENHFYIPEPYQWREQSSSNKQGSGDYIDETKGEQLSHTLISHCVHGFELYEQALAIGVAKEQARLFLAGFGVYYTGVWKIDCHNLIHFLQLRLGKDAQYEIRVYAQAIWHHFFKTSLPWTSEAVEKYIFDDNTDLSNAYGESK